MQPERWRQIEELYHSAQIRAGQERAAFLEVACAGDTTLRAEVESLLASGDEAESFIEKPALQTAALELAEEMSESADEPEPDGLVGRFVSHYHIQQKLGGGGMGIVYRAEDIRLARFVAMKFLSEDLAKDPKALARFQREARTASALSHPNICTVYEVGEHDGRPFIATELLEGQTLQKYLSGKPLDIPEIVRISEQIGKALDNAHAKGIIHRDIKPANIFITREGVAKILDFGLAKPVQTRAASPGKVDPDGLTEDGSADQLTTAGMAVGTIAYMSPEQFRGEELDGRTDIFSFGAVLYEMATGRQAFAAKTAALVSDSILNRDPEPPHRVNPALPEGFHAVVRKALEKDRTRRYDSASALLRDLEGLHASSRVPRPYQTLGMRGRWLLAPVTCLFGTLALLAMPSVRERLRGWIWPLPIPEKVSVAVLPFRSTDGGGEGQAYCQGLGEAATDKLTLLTSGRRLQVAPAKEVLTRGVTSPDAARKELGTNLVFQGGCSQSGNELRVSLAMVDTASMAPLRSETITGETAQPFALHDSVVQAMTRMLEVELTPGEHRAMVTHGTQIPGAYTYYVLGRGYLADPYKVENVEKAISLFEQALQLDANYPLAYTGLGLAFWEKYELTEETNWVDTARISCERAQTLDPRLAAAHLCVATVLNGIGQYDKASAAFRLALDSEPTNDEAYRGLAFAQEHLGQLEAAEKTYLEAIKLRPEYWMSYNWLGIFYYRQNRYSKAAEMWGKMVALAPDSFMGYCNLGSAYFSLGRYAEAIQLYEHSIAIRPTAFALANLGTAYYYQRRFAESIPVFEKALKLNDRDSYTWGNLGAAYYWAPGERQKSTAALQKAVALGKEKLKVVERDSQLLRQLANYSSMLGEREAAMAYLQRARTLSPHDAELEYYAAMVYAQFGDVTMTLESLQKAISWGYSRTTVLSSPDFDNLREDLRFQKLMRQ